MFPRSLIRSDLPWIFSSCETDCEIADRVTLACNAALWKPPCRTTRSKIQSLRSWSISPGSSGVSPKGSFPFPRNLEGPQQLDATTKTLYAPRVFYLFPLPRSQFTWPFPHLIILGNNLTVDQGSLPYL